MNKGLIASLSMAAVMAVAPHGANSASKGLVAFQQAAMTNE